MSDEGGALVRLVPPPPRDDVARARVVGILEELLARARASEFLDLCLVATGESGNTALRWTPLQDPTRMVGQLHLMAHQLLHGHTVVG